MRSAQLVVAADDADLVEELIGELDHLDALEVEDDGGDAGTEVLSTLSVAAAILSGAPGHVQAAEEEEVVEAAGALREAARPLV